MAAISKFSIKPTIAGGQTRAERSLACCTATWPYSNRITFNRLWHFKSLFCRPIPLLRDPVKCIYNSLGTNKRNDNESTHSKLDKYARTYYMHLLLHRRVMHKFRLHICRNVFLIWPINAATPATELVRCRNPKLNFCLQSDQLKLKASLRAPSITGRRSSPL